jgi:hypothetical protein
MADMTVIVGGDPADVDLDVSLLDGPEGFLGPGQCIVYLDWHELVFELSDELTKSREKLCQVIPEKKGIQYFQYVAGLPDTRFRGYDDFCETINK